MISTKIRTLPTSVVGGPMSDKWISARVRTMSSRTETAMMMASFLRFFASTGLKRFFLYRFLAVCIPFPYPTLYLKNTRISRNLKEKVAANRESNVLRRSAKKKQPVGGCFDRGVEEDAMPLTMRVPAMEGGISQAPR